jgi:hypothetical protein
VVINDNDLQIIAISKVRKEMLILLRSKHSESAAIANIRKPFQKSKRVCGDAPYEGGINIEAVNPDPDRRAGDLW